MKNKLPPCFAFKNTGNHPRKDEIRERFNELVSKEFSFNNEGVYYGRNSGGFYDWFIYISNFGSTVVEITEDDFLAMTEPELTKLPDNFYFQYVDEKDREALKERFNKIARSEYEFNAPNGFYGIMCNCHWYRGDRDAFHSTEISQADFIRLTEPEKKVEPEQSNFPYKGGIKDFPKEVGIWMMDCQEAQGNKRDISVFEKEKCADESMGGFDWGIVDSDFCIDVIGSKNFGLFFEKYPKYTSPEQSAITGQIIEISERGILIELTQEQIKEFKIFEVVTVK